MFSGTNHPAEALSWMKEVDMANSVDDLKTSRSISRRQYQNFETLDARIATALKKTTQNSNFKKEGPLQDEQKAQEEDRFLRGRQISFVIYEHFWVTGTHETILDFSDITGVTLRGDDVLGFGTRSGGVLLSTHEVLSDNILESLFKMQIRESGQIKTALAVYEQKIAQKSMPPSCQRLKTMVKKFLDLTVRGRNFEADTEEP